MTIEKLLNKISEYNPSEVDRVKMAYEYAEELHKGQYRQSGEPYIIHPLSVAYILAEIHADGDTLCAGLLHDTLEDTSATKEEITELFGQIVANLVDGVTKFEKKDFKSKKDEEAANTRKIINGLTNDVRIIIIKLADRLHNMRTLQFKTKEKQKENALETLEIFVPLAYYLGVNSIKSELEDLSFMYLKENEYKKSEELREKIIIEQNPLLEEMLHNISTLLSNNGIPNDIKIRIKNIYGIYRRLIRKDRDPHDLLALKVIVDEIDACYRSLGIIHSAYHPINNKFKDYLCSPKNNMYQSLHTTVMNPNGTMTQVQIRTREMDNIATYGLPIYWEKFQDYGNYMMYMKMHENHILFDSITEMNGMYKNDKTFIKEIKRELFEEKIEVYATNGDRVTLPISSTPIDFAYRIHTEVGNRMVSVLVNGEEVPFDYKLQDKDRVVILTDESSFPSKEWLNMAKTSHARRKIRESIRKK